ncbi:hypothetical protein BD410DRAFT_693710, partial [Rickenella mellea]
LYLLQQILHASNRTLENFNLPSPQENWAEMTDNRLIAEQQNYEPEIERNLSAENIPKLNIQQRNAHDVVVQSVMQNKPQLFFISGPGGTGKTFCYNTLCHTLRAEEKIVLCVASSGIASLLLIGGRTAHSVFKIPIPVHNESVCSFTKNSMVGELIQRTDLII